MTTQQYFKSFRQNCGLTLIELMITVIVIGILFGVGLPSLTNMLNNSALSSSSRALVNSIAYAREEALDKSVCAGVGGIGATGWNVWVDQDADCTFDNPGEIVFAEDITGNNARVSGATAIIFNAEGQPNAAASITVGHNEVSNTKAISVAQAGYTTVSN
jgi:type IV fimbrial biogenesis protein FimT